jgi:hypothetical protein
MIIAVFFSRKIFNNMLYGREFVLFFNVNLHTYHYAGNNPVKYVDPDGNYLINNVDERVPSAMEYARNERKPIWPGATAFLGKFSGQYNVPNPSPGMVSQRSSSFVANEYGIVLENGLNEALQTAIAAKNDNNPSTTGKITVSIEEMENDRYKINITVSSNRLSKPVSGTIAFAGATEVEAYASNDEIDYEKVARIANEAINIVRDTMGSKNNIDEVVR